jgi:DNA-directed RNA polymerase specialized sigma24 family protein
MNGLPVAEAVPVTLRGESAERLSALFDAHYDRLYRLARRLVSSADAARDLVQEAFLKAARASVDSSRFGGRGSVAGPRAHQRAARRVAEDGRSKATRRGGPCVAGDE